MATLIAPSPAAAVNVPRLENGDHLTRDEFERRWDAYPEIKRAELIDGVVFLDVTVGPRHARQHSRVIGWLTAYWALHPEIDVVDNVSVRLPGGQELQPDAALYPVPASPSDESDAPLDLPPSLVVEVASSSSARDLNRKRAIYLESGVHEYVVWLLREGAILWWESADGRWVVVEPDQDGVIESQGFPGLRLDVPKMLAGDLAGVLAALHVPASTQARE